MEEAGGFSLAAVIVTAASDGRDSEHNVVVMYGMLAAAWKWHYHACSRAPRPQRFPQWLGMAHSGWIWYEDFGFETGEAGVDWLQPGAHLRLP